LRVGVDARLVDRGLGIANVVSSLSRALAESGVEVVWFGDPALAPPSMADVARPPGPGFAGLDSGRGRRLVKRHRLDVMHFAANSGWWREGPVPHVVTVHDLIWRRSSPAGQSPRQRFGHAYLRLAVPRALTSAAAVSTPSQVTAAGLRDAYGVTAEVIHNGVEAAWQRQVPKPRARYVVAFSGRDGRKGVEIVLAAWESVAERGLGLKVLAGAGMPPRFEPRLLELQRQGRIEVLPYQPRDRLVEIVGGALALLYPSRDEGFGLPVAEAMTAGVPVITGLAPVTLEIGGKAILGLDPDDPVSSATRQLERLLDDPAYASQVGEQSRQWAQRFSWTAAADRYAALYRQALSR
jgi:glycosyltransferase involved in cell wall biosynthesis